MVEGQRGEGEPVVGLFEHFFCKPEGPTDDKTKPWAGLQRTPQEAGKLKGAKVFSAFVKGDYLGRGIEPREQGLGLCLFDYFGLFPLWKGLSFF